MFCIKAIPGLLALGRWGAGVGGGKEGTELQLNDNLLSSKMYQGLTIVVETMSNFVPNHHPDSSIV